MNTARRKLLEEIYAPLVHMKPRSPEYTRLALTGKCWHDYFDPGNMERYGYKSLEKEHSSLLNEIDRLRASIKLPISTIAKTLVAEYAHQSVMIESNHLELGESLIIAESLRDNLFQQFDMASMKASSLISLTLPTSSELLPQRDSSEVAELRNHIIASQWVAETAARQPGTPGLGEAEIHGLAALMVKDTASEALYSCGWGGISKPGDYRRAPIQVRSNPLRIFPYHVEVPSLMKQFISWRDNAHNQKLLHPLLLACQSCVYFLYIHPFIDGNGRVGRTLMHDYMVRQGYIPIVMLSLEQEDYLHMVSDAQDGNPEAFVEQVLSTQLDMMRTFVMRELESENGQERLT
ncbi:fic/DOC family protein [Zopfia rhizophila CBS 207.26]|uniref:Fic/DOC family protein n=1 Tax=Zopfia rhizophila CBS 207.26 TaxID=1314779 RepID=A0A6A6EAG3_9PEZI|nr:fic/DOC family protein [Zopfia rhizophila CBS 207.26]